MQPDVTSHPAHRLMYSSGVGLKMLGATGVCRGFGQVRMHPDAEVPCQRGGFTRSRSVVTENGEHGARAMRSLSSPWPIMPAVHGIGTGGEIRRWSGPRNPAAGHRPSDRSIDPRVRMKAPRTVCAAQDLRGQQIAALWEDVMVVGRGGASRQHQMREPADGRHIDGLFVDTRPHGIQGGEPLEQGMVGGQSAVIH